MSERSKASHGGDILAIGFAIIADIFMLPAVLLQFDRRKSGRED